MWIADCHTATEKCSRPVLNVLHVSELTEEVGPDKPFAAWQWLGKSEADKMAQSGTFRETPGAVEVPKFFSLGSRNQAISQTAVKGCDAICG